MTNINIGKFEKYLYPRIVPLVLDESQKQRLKLTKYYDQKTSEEEKKEILKMIVSTTIYPTTSSVVTTNMKEQLKMDELSFLLQENQKTREQYWYDFFGKMRTNIQKMLLQLQRYEIFRRNFNLLDFATIDYLVHYIEYKVESYKDIFKSYLSFINPKITRNRLYFYAYPSDNDISNPLAFYSNLILYYSVRNIINSIIRDNSDKIQVKFLYFEYGNETILELQNFRFVQEAFYQLSKDLSMIDKNIQIEIENSFLQLIGKFHFFFRIEIKQQLEFYIQMYYKRLKSGKLTKPLSKEDEEFALQWISQKL